MRWHPVSLAGASRRNQSGGLPQLRQASLATARLRSGRRAEEDRNAEADGLRHNLCSDIDGFSLHAAKRRSSCAATWPANRERPLRGDHSGTANVRRGSVSPVRAVDQRSFGRPRPRAPGNVSCTSRTGRPRGATHIVSMIAMSPKRELDIHDRRTADAAMLRPYGQLERRVASWKRSTRARPRPFFQGGPWSTRPGALSPGDQRESASQTQLPKESEPSSRSPFSYFFSYPQEKSTWRLRQVLDLPTEFGRRDWTRTSDEGE